jgi:hypothetical protein
MGVYDVALDALFHQASLYTLLAPEDSEMIDQAIEGIGDCSRTTLAIREMVDSHAREHGCGSRFNWRLTACSGESR